MPLTVKAALDSQKQSHRNDVDDVDDMMLMMMMLMMMRMTMRRTSTLKIYQPQLKCGEQKYKESLRKVNELFNHAVFLRHQDETGIPG